MDSPLPLPTTQAVPSPSPFSSLSTELIQSIFSASPDASTLKSFALTCSTFYHAFLNAEPLIVRSVLHNQIGPDLLYDAMIVYISTTLDSSMEGADFLRSHPKRKITCPSPKWDLGVALAIGHLHDIVEDFTAGFATLALCSNPLTGLDEPSPSPPSLLESCRIKRSFYRFELYCNIFWNFKSISRSKYRSLQSAFFSIMEAWEHEQVKCIHDYLLHRLSVPYNDVAEHDVEWAHLALTLFEDPMDMGDRDKKHYLDLGLAYLHRLVNVMAFEDRCLLLKAPKEARFHSPSNTLICSYRTSIHKRPPPAESYEEDVSPRLSLDDNSGPEKAWRCVFTDSTSITYRSRIAYRKTLRKRGYVMWDYSRLLQWGFLDHEWHELPPEPPVDNLEYNRREAQRVQSFDARVAIWYRGGRGWWNPGDESRITWPPGAPKPEHMMEDT